MEQTLYNISVIIPVYNAQSYLDRCIRSILAQTLSGVEIILVDDGSTDESGSMCDAYAAREPRIRVLHLENGGPARARNHGIRAAQGTYLSFVDADDHVAPDMFERLFEMAEDTGSDIAMCSYALDAAGTIRPVALNYRPLYSGDEVKNDLLRRYYTGDHKGLYSMCNKLFRRSFIREHALQIDERLRRGEDAWFIFDCLKAARVVSFRPEVLYYYYQNPGSIMHSLSPDQFEKWTDNRQRLLRENEQLQFPLDNDQFYGDYLYKTVIFCREMAQSGATEPIRAVLRNEFFLRAVPYRKNLPPHIRLLLRLTEKRHERTALMFFRLWGLRK